MPSIQRRIEQLENAAGHHDEPTVCVCHNHPDETTDDAIARYRTQRPDIPERAWFIVVDTGLYRAPGSFARPTGM